MAEYITIAEFATAVGVTRQAVYKWVRVDKALQPFVKLVDGQKMIDASALPLYTHPNDCKERVNEAANVVNEPCKSNVNVTTGNVNEHVNAGTGPVNELCKDVNSSAEPTVNVTNDSVNDMVDGVNEFTLYLQAENERLRQDVAAKDALIASYVDRFAALVEREQEISARALQTTGQAQLLHASTQDENQTEQGKKKGFFSRLFG